MQFDYIFNQVYPNTKDPNNFVSRIQIKSEIICSKEETIKSFKNLLAVPDKKEQQYFDLDEYFETIYTEQERNSDPELFSKIYSLLYIIKSSQQEYQYENYSKFEHEVFMKKHFFDKVNYKSLPKELSEDSLNYFLKFPYSEQELKEILNYTYNLIYECGRGFGELYFDDYLLERFCETYPLYTAPTFLQNEIQLEINLTRSQILCTQIDIWLKNIDKILEHFEIDLSNNDQINLIKKQFLRYYSLMNLEDNDIKHHYNQTINKLEKKLK